MSESIEQIREKAKGIVARINADPDFKAQVERDPEGTLILAGLPAEAVPDFLSEAPLSSINEVSGYGTPGGCSFTCFVTCEFTGVSTTL